MSDEAVTTAACACRKARCNRSARPSHPGAATDGTQMRRVAVSQFTCTPKSWQLDGCGLGHRLLTPGLDCLTRGQEAKGDRLTPSRLSSVFP